MSFVDLPLPTRQLAISGRPVAVPAGFFFTVVILLAMAGFFAWWQGPGLWRDIQINQNPVTLSDADVLDGECTTRRGVTDCDARLVYDYEGQSYDTQVSVMFVDFSTSDYLVEVVISADKPELATITLGLEKLWNRLAVFTVFQLLFLGGGIAMLLGGLRAWRANRGAGVPGRLTLVPVEVTDTHKRGGSSYVSYADLDARGKKRVTRSRFRRDEAPLMAVDESGTLVGVAVQSEHTAVPILLDSELHRLDLSERERQHALAAFDAQQQGRSYTEAATAKPAPKASPLRGLLAGLGVLVVLALGLFGYWLYYVTAAPDAFDSIGMEVNNLMPGPLNTWGCEQLEARFGDDRAPFGCVAEDYTSWKTATKTKTKS